MKSLKDFLHKEIIEESSPDDNGDGVLSPAELHHHLDIQKRGIVDLGDYAAHIMFHAHHPEYLAPVMEKFNDIQRLHAAGQEINPYDPVLSKLKDNRALVATSNPMMEGKTSLSRELDPPAVLIMRRKSVRQFPNGQRVALYVDNKYGLTFPVPYDQSGTGFKSMNTVSPGPLNAQRGYVNEEVLPVVFSTGEEINVEKDIMDKIKSVFDSLNEENKQRLSDMVLESPETFNKVKEFALLIK